MDINKETEDTSLRSIRNALGLSNKDISETTKLSASYISRIERGQMGGKFDRINLILNALEKRAINQNQTYYVNQIKNIREEIKSNKKPKNLHSVNVTDSDLPNNKLFNNNLPNKELIIEWMQFYKQYTEKYTLEEIVYELFCYKKKE